MWPVWCQGWLRIYVLGLAEVARNEDGDDADDDDEDGDDEHITWCSSAFCQASSFSLFGSEEWRRDELNN